MGTTTTRKTARRKTTTKKDAPSKPPRKKKSRYAEDTLDIAAALDAAAEGNAREALRVVRLVRSPEHCFPLKVENRLPELARVWGLAARQEDCERHTEEPACGEAWKWEPLASDHWYEFLVVTESARAPGDCVIVQQSLAAFRAAYFGLDRVAAGAIEALEAAGAPVPPALPAPKRRNARSGRGVTQRFLYDPETGE